MTIDRVVVIGSGPAGAMAAYELVACGIPVTMLESGHTVPSGLLVRALGRNLVRRVPTLASSTDFIATGDPATEWYVNLSPGGLSNQWTGAVPRFAPEDFEEGQRLHERYRWPLSYADLAPWYAAAERLLRVNASEREFPLLPSGHVSFAHELPPAWQTVSRVARARDRGFAPLPLADGPPFLMVRRGAWFNSYSVLIAPLLARPDFRLVCGAHALQIEYEGASRRAVSVVYAERGTRARHRLPAAAVVVACGALHSTKLLFDSACPDFPLGLGDSHGLLGRFLHDHPRAWWAVDFDPALPLLSPAAYLTRRPHAVSSPLLATSCTLGVESTRDKIRSRAGLWGRSLGVQVFGTMVPSERYFVKPSEERKDEFGLPALEISLRFESDVRANLEAAKSDLLSLLEAAGHRGKIRDPGGEIIPGSSVHYGGTVRMHASPRLGMLDAWNRLHEVANVIVCDSSCFTTGGEKNPTLTAMALSARAAWRLAEDLRGGCE